MQEKEEALKKVKANFESLRDKIPEIKAYKLGVNVSLSPSAFDLVIDSDFETEEDLKAYQGHPAHRKAVEFNSNYSSEKAVVDYIY